MGQNGVVWLALVRWCCIGDAVVFQRHCSGLLRYCRCVALVLCRVFAQNYFNGRRVVALVL
jgi:hypothetical protein